jgi:excisionase family DNA binding protein
MGQRLRDWYRFLEQQIHVSLPEEPVDASAGSGRSIGGSHAALYGSRLGADGAHDPPGSTPHHPHRSSDALPAALTRREAPDGSALNRTDPRRRGGRRPITETREQIVRRLFDPELTLHEAAAVLNLSKATVRRYTDQGKLACLRTHGGQRRFRLSALLEFLDRREPHGAA